MAQIKGVLFSLKVWIKDVCLSGVGGPSVFVLLLLANEETALDLLIGQNLGRQRRQN